MSEANDRRIIKAMINEDYAMLSGPPGPRPYDSVKHHYHKAARRVVRTGVDENGRPFATVMTVDEHHADVDRKFVDMAFLEEELDHQCEVFGNIARVRSVYRSVYQDQDPRGAKGAASISTISFARTAHGRSCRSSGTMSAPAFRSI